MLKSRLPVRGVTLIEIMVALGIFSFLLAMAAPTIGTWIQNSRIRTSAESIVAGLQRAKSEAVSRNARVRFQLTTSAANDCVLTTTATNWVVNVDTAANPNAVAGLCGNSPSDTVAPFIVQVRPASEGSLGVAMASSVSNVVFNGLGRPVGLGGNVTMDLSYPAAGDCSTASITCLRVVVTTQGLIRMCSPRLTTTSPNDARAC
jgi:type IV fimbrial biogenesis protein FimT